MHRKSPSKEAVPTINPDKDFDLATMDIANWDLAGEEKQREILQKFLDALQKNKISEDTARELFTKKFGALGVPLIWYIARWGHWQDYLPEIISLLLSKKMITVDQLNATDKVNGTNALFWLLMGDQYRDVHGARGETVHLPTLDLLIKHQMITTEGLSPRVHFQEKEKKEAKLSDAKAADLKDHDVIQQKPKDPFVQFDNMNTLSALLKQMVNPRDENQFKKTWHCFMRLLTSETRGGPIIIKPDLLLESFYKILEEDVYPNIRKTMWYKEPKIFHSDSYQSWLTLWFMAFNMIASMKGKRIIPPADHYAKDDYEQPRARRAIASGDGFVIELIKTALRPSIHSVADLPFEDKLFKDIFMGIIYKLSEDDKVYLLNGLDKDRDFEMQAHAYADALYECQLFKSYFTDYLFNQAKAELHKEVCDKFTTEITKSAREAVLRSRGGHWRMNEAWGKSFKEMLQLGLDDFFKQYPGESITLEIQQALIQQINQDIAKEVTAKEDILCPERIVTILVEKLKLDKQAGKQDAKESQFGSPALMFSDAKAGQGAQTAPATAQSDQGPKSKEQSSAGEEWWSSSQKKGSPS